MVYRTEIKQKRRFSGFDTSNLPIVNTGIHMQSKVSDFIMNLIFTWVL